MVIVAMICEILG